jgi:integrase
MGFSLFRIHGRGVWHYRFRVGGRRTQRSTGERSHGKAEEIAFKAYRRERVVKDGGGPVPTLAQLAELWLSIHASTASAAHRRSVAGFARLHLYDLGDVRIDRIRTDAVEQARNAHLQGHAAATANHWLRILRLLCHWAVKRDVVDRVPWRVKMLKVQKKPRVILPVAKATAWLAAVDKAAGERKGIGTAVRLMLGLGLRESEALTARWAWYDEARATYTPGITKGREAEPVAVPPWLTKHLAPSMRTSGLMVRNKGGNPYYAGCTRGVMKVANAACGTPGVSPHRLRGTFATLLSREGVSVPDIQKALRHKDPMTTMGYLELDSGRVAKAQEEIAKKMGFTRQKPGERQPSGVRR